MDEMNPNGCNSTPHYNIQKVFRVNEKEAKLE
jgi:hypothetical protein